MEVSNDFAIVINWLIFLLTCKGVIVGDFTIGHMASKQLFGGGGLKDKGKTKTKTGDRLQSSRVPQSFA